MSDFLNATINNSLFYILPVCNFNTDFYVTGLPDGQYRTTDARGANSSTLTTPQLFQYNDNFGANRSLPLDPNLITGNEGIVIPQYIKDLDIDFISFSVTTDGQTSTNLQHNSYSVTLTLIYDYYGSSPFISGDGTTKDFIADAEYHVDCKFANGVLYPIDLKNIKKFMDIEITSQQTSPVPSTSADKVNKARPYNITFWKRFIKSDPNNRFSFLKQGALPNVYNLHT
jgi:hypothetical protein